MACLINTYHMCIRASQTMDRSNSAICLFLFSFQHLPLSSETVLEEHYVRNRISHMYLPSYFSCTLLLFTGISLIHINCVSLGFAYSTVTKSWQWKSGKKNLALFQTQNVLKTQEPWIRNLSLVWTLQAQTALKNQHRKEEELRKSKNARKTKPKMNCI